MDRATREPDGRRVLVAVAELALSFEGTLTKGEARRSGPPGQLN
jgi:hypothetical protein